MADAYAFDQETAQTLVQLAREFDQLTRNGRNTRGRLWPAQPPNIQFLRVTNLVVVETDLYEARLAVYDHETRSWSVEAQALLLAANPGLEELRTGRYLGMFRGFHEDGRAVFVAQAIGGGAAPPPTGGISLASVSQPYDEATPTPRGAVPIDTVRVNTFSGLQFDVLSGGGGYQIHTLSASVSQTGVVNINTDVMQVLGDGNKGINRSLEVNLARSPYWFTVWANPTFPTESTSTFRYLIHTTPGDTGAEGGHLRNRIYFNWPNHLFTGQPVTSDYVANLSGSFYIDGGIALNPIAALPDLIPLPLYYPRYEVWSQLVPDPDGGPIPRGRLIASKGGDLLMTWQGEFGFPLGFAACRSYYPLRSPRFDYQPNDDPASIEMGDTRDVTIAGVTLKFRGGSFVGLG